MKIAIGIYGHYKNFESCRESIISLKKQYNADVFVRSYTTKSFPDDTHMAEKNKLILEKDFACLEPIKILLENSSDIENNYSIKANAFKRIFKLTPVKEIFSQLISIRNRVKLLELIDISYDFIILIRPDTLILKPIKLDLKKLNFIELLDLYQDSLIAGPSHIIRKLINKVNDNFGIAIDKGNIITCPHKVLKYYSKDYEINLIKNAWVTVIPKDTDTVEKRLNEFSIQSV